jgi:hypothetical protein
MSTKVGVAEKPTLLIPKGLVIAAAKLGSLAPAGAMLRKKSVLPTLLPMNQVQVPVPIDVYQRRAGKQSHSAQSEGVGQR